MSTRPTRSAGKEDACFGTLGKTEHIESSHETCFEGLDRIELIVRRRGRASEMVDLCMIMHASRRIQHRQFSVLTVALSHEGFDDIVSNEFKVRVADPV